MTTTSASVINNPFFFTIYLLLIYLEIKSVKKFLLKAITSFIFFLGHFP